MEISTVIYSRRSIRSYTGEKISSGELKEILRSGNAAPVAMGKFEDSQITVIENKKLLDEIEKQTCIAFKKENFKPLYNAPTLIVISHKKLEGNAINLMYSDSAIIAQNMVLKAVELGVGVCQIWGSIMVMNDEIIKKLDLHEGFVPCCSIIVGKTNEKYEIRNINEDRIAINRI